jgi:hypothetical protein
VAIYVFDAIYYLLPNLSVFSFRTEAANGMTVTGEMLAVAIIYAIAYAAVVLSITIAVFRTRNFK